ncbi:hypothetical protein [Teredinibacter turnerae]|uniref:hypothetical protein n=1 Tax=Teredinibacter turnerae TaxID=2426 RepID=UPI0003753111|nr:hypothetical protein [Teredinibacter turnerae]
MTKKVFFWILVFSLVVFGLIAYVFAEDKFLTGNLLPELIGVSVELLLIIVVFDRWQKHEEKQRKIKIERRLREFLIFFLKDNFENFPSKCKPESFYGEEYEKNQAALDNLVNHIEANGLVEESVVEIQKYCESEKDIFSNLIPVVSELTNDHFKSWVRIAYYMNAIDSKKEKTSKAVVEILKNVKRYDSESFKNGLYVGSK